MLARENGLQRHDVTARTYLHLGAVHVAGLGEREKGLRYLAMALDLRPKIKLQKPMATRDLRGALGEAKRRKQELLGVPPEEERPRNEARAGGKNKERGDRSRPPAMNGQEAIYCPAPEGAPPRKELKLRCFAAPKLRAVRVFLHYRRPDEDYTALQMNREPKGWYSAAIPAADVTGSAMEYFVEAEGAGGKITGTHGDEQQPNVIAVRKGPAGSRLSLADIRMGDSALLSGDGDESDRAATPTRRRWRATAATRRRRRHPDEELRASREDEGRGQSARAASGARPARCGSGSAWAPATAPTSPAIWSTTPGARSAPASPAAACCR